MRSLLLSCLSRLCLSKPRALGVRHLGGARFLSETPICRIVRAEHCGETLKDGDFGRLVIRNVNAYPRNEEVLEKTVPMDLVTETGTIGASHGWVATLRDGVVRLQDDLIPAASDSHPKRISLPPLVTLPHCQTQVVTNVAMSCSSPEDQDCIVAIKFLGPQLSLCRPAQKDPEWVNIRIEDPGYFSSRVMYSKMDKMFSMPASGGTHTVSWDLEENHCESNLRFPRYKEFVKSEWEKVFMLCRSEHLVEAPTGETFLVKWYTQPHYFPEREMWERFLVLKIHRKFRVAECTEDIGDLCIFLSTKGEPFCLQASLYGLPANCVYYVGAYDFGLVNIADNARLGGGKLFSPAPYFIPPQS